MANLNKVFLIGNLTRSPELRYTPSGTAVADLRMAVNRNYTTQGGEKREETCFLTVVVWGKQAESCGEYLDKGSPIMVEGRLQTRDWETRTARSAAWWKSSRSGCSSWGGPSPPARPRSPSRSRPAARVAGATTRCRSRKVGYT
jgi:single-stranded DNA-binding protein